MFEYTREFILNDNVGSLVGGAAAGKRFAAIGDNLVVARMVNLDKKNIVKVTKYPYAAAANEKVELDATKILKPTGKDKIERLVVTIREEGKVTALVNDSYPWHSKYYFYEGFSTEPTSGTYAHPFATWEAQSKKEEEMEAEDRLITVRYDDSVPGSEKLVIEAKDCYTRVFEVRIVEVPKTVATVPVPEVLTGYKDYTSLLDVKMKDMHTVGAGEGNCVLAGKVGTEGAGTVARILKNMRLLTAANINPWGLQRDERPLPNGQYTQYAIEYVVERRGIGSQVMGAVDHSLSNHLFFVESGAVSDFDAALAALQLTVDSVSAATPGATVAPQVIALEKEVPTAAKLKQADATVAGISATGDATVTLS